VGNCPIVSCSFLPFRDRSHLVRLTQARNSKPPRFFLQRERYALTETSDLVAISTSSGQGIIVFFCFSQSKIAARTPPPGNFPPSAPRNYSPRRSAGVFSCKLLGSAICYSNAPQSRGGCGYFLPQMARKTSSSSPPLPASPMDFLTLLKTHPTQFLLVLWTNSLQHPYRPFLYGTPSPSSTNRSLSSLPGLSRPKVMERVAFVSFELPLRPPIPSPSVE